MSFDPQILNVPKGGTGAVSFTDGGVILGNGTGALQVTTAGNAGFVFTSNGTGVDPSFQVALAGISELQTTTNINLKTTGATALYTVPASQTVVITEIVIRITAVSSFISGATISVGKSPSYNEWLAATAMGALSSTVQFRLLSHSAAGLLFQTFTNGEVVAINVTVAAVATTLTASCDVFGYLL